VAEDHQTQNALALVRKDAALYVKDAEAKDQLIAEAMKAVCQPELLNKLSTNIAQLAFTDSANVIAREVCALGETYQKNHGL
jgi:UDP-N-acetylglucosamine--N-acetylmuramyl-(pentapeptide) pyrophosphoryl-undecaprenol N-acetylglucosamine transferase